MNNKDLRYQLPLLLLALLLWNGCTHRPVASSPTRYADSTLVNNSKTTIVKTEDVSPDMDAKDDFDDDFFADEFEEDQVQVADPFSPFNRAMFQFNDKL
ncbi:MAG: hypothetical protein JSW04_12390 [Desulfobacterales bacterium]|nr:MAG: hypothetical protein JSW04_12390 [Desulfobacterales bacterium]